MSAITTKRSEYMKKLRIACNAPPDVEDMSFRWSGEVVAQVMDGSRPLRGRIELLATHVILAGEDGMLLFALPINAILTLQRKKEVHFPSRSFAEEPRLRTLIEMSTATGDVVIVMEGNIGIQVGKAMEVLWRMTFGQLSRREAAMFRSFVPADTLFALTVLPLDVECNLAQQVKQNQVATVDRPVVLRFEENFVVSIISRPANLTEINNLRAITMPLDEVMLIWTKGDEVRLCSGDNRIFLFNDVLDAPTVLSQVMTLFLANAATMVYRSLKWTKSIAPFSHDECIKLFQQYCAVDTDLDGSISQNEFMVSLGPLLATDKVLPKALYNLFDTFNTQRIRFFEYVHASRVLLRGDVEDRLRYIFLLFDTKRKASISSAQFLQGLRTLSQAISLRIPRGETIETFSFNLFKQIDTDDSDDIDFDEFARALTGDVGVIDALQSLSLNKDNSNRLSSQIMSFGHPQWHVITQILTGIQLAVANIEGDGVFNTSFSQKVTYNCVTGATVAKDDKKPSFRRFGETDVLFNDYCPVVFQALRNQFGITNQQYLSSLGIQQLKSSLLFGHLTSLYEMSSSGRSGSFFYSSHDSKYILKTIPAAEAATLRRILPAYYSHLMSNPDTFITRFCGLHSMSRGSDKTYFVVMANIFLAKVPINETFDLKGSTINRSTPVAQRGHGVALKDNDFDTRKLKVSERAKADILKQVTADSALLSKMNLNDYSFLLGVHTSDVPLQSPPDGLCPRPMHSNFQQFYGGVPASSRRDVYFIGIIDVLTEYNIKKMGEHWGKSVLYDGTQVSCVPPADYHDRFVKYLDSILVTA